jgi:DNA polymerase-4
MPFMPLRSLFLDMNAFFASAEQHLRPELRGRPVAVVQALTTSTCCIAASYEARPFGVRTGTNVGEAILKCPRLELVEARHVEYVALHHRIREAVDTVLPIERVHSIDEMSFRLMGPEREPARAAELGLAMKRAIHDRIGPMLRCSVGIGPNAFLAKTASNMQKPDGLTLLRDEDLPEALNRLRLEDLTGISDRMAARLRAAGIRSVRDLCAASDSRLERAWGGVVGRRWAMMLRGEEVSPPETARRQVGHSRILPPEHRTDEGARAVLAHLTQKAAVRLRAMDRWTHRMDVSVAYADRDKWKQFAKLPGVQDTPTLMETFAEIWRHRPAGSPTAVSLALTDLATDASVTPPLYEESHKRLRVSKTLDEINARYGTNAAYFASLQEAKHGAGVRIAFSQIPDISTERPTTGPEPKRA